MAWAKYLMVFFIILVVTSTTCSRKGTEPHKEYREPLSFTVFEVVPCGPPECDYMAKVRDTWDNELKDDQTIRSHTWYLGDYRIFVYFHGYWASGDGSYREVLFFTDSEPGTAKSPIHSTTTIYKADLDSTGLQFSKIGTQVNIDKYCPIENEAEARNAMIAYLSQYAEEYAGVRHDSLLIDRLKRRLQGGGYIRDRVGHYVHYDPALDIGGTIIVNKSTSQLDFLGSSVFGGWGRRYFPLD